MKLTKRKAWCVAPCQRFANFNAWVVPFPKGGVIVSKRLIQFKNEGQPFGCPSFFVLAADRGNHELPWGHASDAHK